jgi:hypothetical protein
LWALNVVKQNGEETQPNARLSWDLLQLGGEERRRKEAKDERGRRVRKKKQRYNIKMEKGKVKTGWI